MENASVHSGSATSTQYQCDAGYIQIGDERIECQGGVWSAAPSCEGNPKFILGHYFLAIQGV